ncbi:MAG: 4-hydroxy-2-oxo-heptane,7-dioate aldolase [Alphaproteobacteria bacterium]|nr:4-hydroxy-2-oxo-heptane,7-dioate aldolase [Alphaproteobacteria bacterium]
MTVLSEAILHNTRGVILLLHDPLVVQILRGQADFFLLDCAARPCSPEIVTALMHAAGETQFLVRPENTDKATLQKYLNLGVDGLVLPDIHYAAELEKIIATCLYPPEGLRPYRPLMPADKISLEAINDQITFIVEIAHIQTAVQLSEIAEVTGVNGFLVSPQRLSIAMEKGSDAAHPSVQQALQSIAKTAASYELPWGIEGSESIENMTANFTVAVRDIDLLSAQSNAAIAAPQKEEEDEDDFPAFTLSARRE